MNENQQKELQNFPTPFVRAVLKDNYSKGESEFSVTELISAPLRSYLKSQGHEKITDPKAMLISLLGTAVHAVLEANVDESQGEIAERRLFAELHGSMVSGQFDFYERRTVFDYKVTGGVQEKCKQEHYDQVQMNGYLARLNGLEVDNVAIVYLQRDWSYLQSTLNPTYPQTGFRVFVHPYDEAYAKECFATKIRDHQQAKLGNWRECTPEEQWAKPDTFALKKPDGKRARKLCDTMAEAVSEQKPGEIIETRKGEKTFCSVYCGYAHCCPQYQREMQFQKSTIE